MVGVHSPILKVGLSWDLELWNEPTPLAGPRAFPEDAQAHLCYFCGVLRG